MSDRVTEHARLLELDLDTSGGVAEGRDLVRSIFHLPPEAEIAWRDGVGWQVRMPPATREVEMCIAKAKVDNAIRTRKSSPT